MSEKIPKIIHQLWIGDKPMPNNLMKTWKDKNPLFTYKLWDNDAVKTFNFKCQHRIDEMTEINGKADIMRWEILYEYGGIFIDADSICIEPFDELIYDKPAFAGWENEIVRKGLIATGTMGFPPKHPLVKAAIDWIDKNEVNPQKTKKRAWQTVGPMRLTQTYSEGRVKGLYTDVFIFPSFFFLPIHCTGLEYKAHGKVYAYQEWGSTKQNYDTMNSLTCPPQFNKPDKSVSILLPIYNTSIGFVKQALQSIVEQNAYVCIDLIIINDGSNDIVSQCLEELLNKFVPQTRWITLHYKSYDTNMGLGYALHEGVLMSPNELIFRMDADDIMTPDRVAIQMEFMENNPEIMLYGSQVNIFIKNDLKKVVMTTEHPEVVDIDYLKRTRSHWFMNHPTWCFRKQAIIDVGNYNKDIKSMYEDYELALRVIKKYKHVANHPEVLLYYRNHPQQVTNSKNKKVDGDTTRNNYLSQIIFC